MYLCILDFIIDVLGFGIYSLLSILIFHPFRLPISPFLYAERRSRVFWLLDPAPVPAPK